MRFLLSGLAGIILCTAISAWVALYLARRQLRAIIGPNGAGKTTFMDIVTGKTRPDAGSVTFGERSVSLLSLSEAQIARIRKVLAQVDTDGSSTALIPLRNAGAREIATSLQTLIGGGEVIRRRFGDGPGGTAAYLPSVFSGAGLVSVFAALLAGRLMYGLIGPEVTFAGLVLTALAAVVLGWLHGPLLAALGLVGATVAPFLTGGGSQAPAWLMAHFALVAALGLGIDTLRRWGWVSVLSLALAYAGGLLAMWAGAGEGAYLLLAVALVPLAIAIPAAWSMAFVPGRRTKDLLMWMLSTKMMPAVGVLVPMYLMFRDFGLLDTRIGLVVVLTLINLPIVIWMLYTYFREIPGEILEASRMDGASLFNEIVYVLTPMALPGIASTLLLNIILAWNEAFWTIRLTTTNAAPLTAFIASFSSPQGLFWAKLSAASTMAIAPIVILGWFSQKQLVRGLTFGAVK